MTSLERQHLDDRPVGGSPQQAEAPMSTIQSEDAWEKVTIDMSGLIDKVLARYPGGFTVFRELLQNSDDARSKSAEIHFKTVAVLDSEKTATNEGTPGLPDLKATNVVQWTFKNNGAPFGPDDWKRLPKIALGNPHPDKVGAFGVGFYSLFSVTRCPVVSSDGKEMAFKWKGDQLYFRFGGLPETATRDPWTAFRIPLREVTPMPPLSELMEYLTSSMTFLSHLEDVTVFLDDDQLGKVKKSVGQPRTICIPTELKRSSNKIMTVKSVQQYPITVETSLSTHDTRMDLAMFTAEADVTVDDRLREDLDRCTKKPPPSCLKYNLIYIGKDEYDQNRNNEQKHPSGFSSPSQDLWVDLDGSTRTRIFIGHATSQTTGMGGHMASRFIPTVERESIDLANVGVRSWNEELLYVGGFLSRVVYESELSEIQNLWEKEAQSHVSRELRDRLNKRFLHVLKFFTFHGSHPSSKVAELLEKSFYGCSTLPLRVLSSVGVREAPDVRAFDAVVAKFLRSVPMLSEYVTRHGQQSITALKDEHKIRTITPLEVLEYLRNDTLDIDQLVACLRWWIESMRDDSTQKLKPADLADAVTFSSAGGTTRLSSVACFIEPVVLGPHIPPDGPLPESLIHPDISRQFDSRVLRSFGWDEFTVVSWLQYISRPDIISNDENYDFTRSNTWARRVLRVLCRLWPRLTDHMQNESKEVLKDKPCVPTSLGLRCPEYSYLPVADSTLLSRIDLAIVSHDPEFEADENMKKSLWSIGVQSHIPVDSLLHEGLTTEDVLRYLVHGEPSWTSEYFSSIKSLEIFVGENSRATETNRYRADQLYPPVNFFRVLQLPTIQWSGKSSWSDTSREAKLLYRLGLNHSPPLSTIMDLCLSADVPIQKAAFLYLCDNLDSQYKDYKPENFSHVAFIPAKSKDATCLMRLEEVYSDTRWGALGFCVVQDEFQGFPIRQLGVAQDPSASKLLDQLENNPPHDRDTAIDWFETLSDHVSVFSRSQRDKLSKLSIVPTSSSTPKLLPPSECYLDERRNPRLYEELFVFVDFGDKANLFLKVCGLKDKVPTEDVAKKLVDDPQKFFDLAGGYDDFLVELRKLAHHRQDISNPTLYKMSNTPSLLGVRQRNTEDQAGSGDVYQFKTSQEIVIVDDIDDYQLFSDSLFVAPREEALENFYVSLGCNYLSAVVQDRCNELSEIVTSKATTTCAQVRSSIVERLPLFNRIHTDKPEVTTHLDRLEVKACRKIVVSKSLAITKVKQTREVRATVKREGDCIELWISLKDRRDIYYDISKSLCRLWFETNKVNDVLLLETILCKDLKVLQQRGIPIDQIPPQRDDGDSAGTRSTVRSVRLASSTSTIISAQYHQSELRSHPEKLRRASRASQPSFSRFSTDGVSLKVSEISNETSATVGNSTPLLSRSSFKVFSQTEIGKIVSEAIRTCGSGKEKPVFRVGEKNILSSSFCSCPTDMKCLKDIDKLRGIRVWVDKGMQDDKDFKERKHEPLARFVDIIITLSEVYGISVSTLHIFYVSEERIAFNHQGNIYLNLHYFEEWHYKQVKSGNQQNALMSWFLTLAHEIAHNITVLHNADHEFWFSAICEAYLPALSRLLQPQAADIWFRRVLWLALVVNTILFAYLVRMVLL